jgi:hypothetical protein
MKVIAVVMLLLSGCASMHNRLTINAKAEEKFELKGNSQTVSVGVEYKF